jgi:multicomponent Na+:H+ antiporter subunit E
MFRAPADKRQPHDRQPRRPTFRNVLFRFLLFSLLWWAMSEGQLHHLLPSALIVSATTATSLLLVPSGTWRFRLAALPRFMLYFFHQSLLGGIDVAGRALHPRLPLRPDLVEYRLELERQVSRVFFVWVVSLLPGTAGVSLEGDVVRIHVLDTGQPQRERLRVLERKIEDLFGSGKSRFED